MTPIPPHEGGSDLDAAKRALRKETLARLAALPAEEIARASAAIAARVMAMAWWGWPAERIGAVMLYAPMAREVDVRAVGRAALARGLIVALPEVRWSPKGGPVEGMAGRDGREGGDGGGGGGGGGGNALIPRRVMSVDEGLVVRRGGVPEPAASCPEVKVGEIGVMLVPGVAFDASGKRLGRGGGFYDRLIGHADRRALLVGVALDEQVAGEIPVGPLDARVDAVVTPSRVFEVPARDGRR